MVSVIIPVYKVEKYLRDCLDSVCLQSYSELEILLVDDCSPDECSAICDEYAVRDDRIRVIHKPVNEGLGFARNTGLSAASGDYVCFVDSDDFLPEGAVDRLVQAASLHRADIVSGNHQRVLADGTVSAPLVYEAGVFDRDQMSRVQIRYPLFFSSAHLVSAWGKLYRLDFLKKHGLRFDRNSEIYEEDRLFAFKAAACTPRYYIMTEVVYFYRFNPDSIMSTYKPQYAKRLCAFMKEYSRYLESRNEWKEFFDLLAFQCAFSVYLCYRNERGKIGGMNEMDAFLTAFAENDVVRKIMRELVQSKAVRSIPAVTDRIFMKTVAFLLVHRHIFVLKLFLLGIVKVKGLD